MKILQSLFLLFSKSLDPNEDFFLPPKHQPAVKGTKIKILHPCSGSNDGFTVQRFDAGQTCKVSAALAESLITAGFAEKA
jgi:hypothetical protein